MFKKQHVASVLDVPDFVHIRAPHTFANFSNTGGLSAPPGVSSTVPCAQYQPRWSWS